MYSVLARHVLYPIGEAFIGASMLKHLKVLEKTQWWSPAELRELQNEKLRKLMGHVYRNVPYYRRILVERGLTDKDIDTIEDLSKLPVLTKEDVRRNSSDLMAEDFKRWKPILSPTSGSTGEPLRYYVGMDVASVTWASMFRSWAWAGYELGDKRVTFAGSALVPPTGSLKSRLRNLVERNLALSPSRMTEEAMGTYVEKIRKFRPKYIRGFPSSIYMLAEYVERRAVENIRPRAIFTTGESLHLSHRRAMERVFKCEVFDQYGLYDGGAMIMECPTHEGYHIMAEKAVIEIMNGQRPSLAGEQGEIVTTDLHNYAMPFIRYATGDLAVLSDAMCSCGRGLPVVEALEGRKVNLIVLSDGSAISGLVLTDIFEYMTRERPESIKQFQIVQEAVGHIAVKLVPGPDYSPSDTASIVSDIKKHVGSDWDVGVEFVDGIPATSAGKRLFVISKVSI